MTLLGNTEANYKATVEQSDKKISEYCLHSENCKARKAQKQCTTNADLALHLSKKKHTEELC